MDQTFNQVSQQSAQGYTTLPQCQSQAQAGLQLNAVKIDIINPKVNVGQGKEALPYNMPIASAYPQYAPIYSYPECNAVPCNYIPVQQKVIQSAPAAASIATPPSEIDNQQAPETSKQVQGSSAPAAASVAPPPSEANNQQAAPAAASVTQQLPAVDAQAINTALQSKNPDEQTAAIQKIAEIAQNSKEQSLALMASSNGLVYKSLTAIVAKDTSKLNGPEKEKAELNKEIGMWTMAILLKNFREALDNEAQKQKVPPISISELGGLIIPIVKNVQADPNPEIRKGGMFAMAYIAKPQDYETLSTAFNIVIKRDKDKGVKEAAKKILSELPKPEAKPLDTKKAA